MVSSLLAGRHPFRAHWFDSSASDQADIHRKSSSALVGWLVDVPLPVHGTDLFASHGSGHYRSVGIFSSKRTPDLDRCTLSFDLGWMESCQLVSCAGNDCRCFIFAGRTDRWKAVVELSSQAVSLVCPRYDHRVRIPKNLYCSIWNRQPTLLLEPFLRLALGSLVAECILFSRFNACYIASFCANVAGDVLGAPHREKGSLAFCSLVLDICCAICVIGRRTSRQPQNWRRR